MNTVFHASKDRGHANHGWLNAHHSFSFAGFYHPDKVHFGLLRVLNDDRVAAGMGFSTHPHSNMEIITIPTSGSLRHQDSTGGSGVIQTGEVQIMSAGSGIEHSEKNASTTEPVTLFQIWIFPEKENIAPRYDQRFFNWKEQRNEWTTVVAPNDEKSLWINQQAWIQLTVLEAGKSISYQPHQEGNGLYLMTIEGAIELAGQTVGRRDALGVWDVAQVEILAKETSELLLIEVPMQ